MSEDKKSKYRGFTPAQAEAHKRYMKDFVEIKVRMTADKRSIVQEHAASMWESATAFINRAIDETMQHDNQVESVIDRSPKSEISTALNKSSSEKTADRDTEKLTEQAPNSAILSPDVLEEAQNAAAASGEAVPEFVSRAVKTQVKRDEASRRMGLDPVTGDRLKHEAPST